MATKSHRITARRSVRISGGAAFRRSLIVLGARTAATIVLMFVAHWLHLSTPE